MNRKIKWCFFLLSSLLIIFCRTENLAQEKGQEKPIRPAVVAGGFYPGNPLELRRKVLGYLKNVKSLGIPNRIISILVPHAGYEYSGQIAALAYKQIENKKIDTIILIGPSHRVGFPTISIYPRGYYQTPLGLVEIDADLAKKLIAADRRIQFFPPAHRGEHSLEVQLPFLQEMFPEIKIVPVVMGGQTRENVELMIGVLTQIIEKTKDKQIMLITTCDYSHFYSYDRAVQLDRVAMQGIEQMDYQKFLLLVEKKKCEMDAFGPVAVTMEVARRLGANKARVLKYANSGDVTGDKSRVVGYAAVLFLKDN